MLNIHRPTALWLKTRRSSSAPAVETPNSTVQNSFCVAERWECCAPVPIRDFVRHSPPPPGAITESDVPKPLHPTNTMHRARSGRTQPFERAEVRLPMLPPALRHLPTAR